MKTDTNINDWGADMKCDRCGEWHPDTTMFFQTDEKHYGQHWCTDCVLATEED